MYQRALIPPKEGEALAPVASSVKASSARATLVFSRRFGCGTVAAGAAAAWFWPSSSLFPSAGSEASGAGARAPLVVRSPDSWERSSGRPWSTDSSPGAPASRSLTRCGKLTRRFADDVRTLAAAPDREEEEDVFPLMGGDA